jgi:hypothetical protein
MIRTVVTPEKQNISIHVTESFVGKKVEVIVFTSDEVEQEALTTDKPLTYLASENVLAKDWLSPEEDKAWQHL